MSQPAKDIGTSLIGKISQKSALAKEEFDKKHEFAKQWLLDHGLTLDQIRTHSTKILTGATLGSALLLASPQIPILGKTTIPIHKKYFSVKEFLSDISKLKSGKVTSFEEEEIMQNIKKYFGTAVAFELDKNRLPAYFGTMGLEQHLIRFPGDRLSQHDQFQEVGMAPGRGAFGFFSDEGKTPAQVETEEKYYIVLPTFTIEGWDRDWPRLKEWYKFRKFFVVNPTTGKAVICVSGDSGPATWTDRQFGGSPEVMAELGFYPTVKEGNVFVIFVDDPGNKVPLGPVSVKGE